MASKPEKILCAIDFSPFSTPVIRCAVQLALQTQSRLLVFHAVQPPRSTLYAGAAFPWKRQPNNPTQDARHKIAQLMQDFPPIWEPRVETGPPVELIQRIVKAEGVDLVVAASHGLSGFKRLLLGTVVERLARQVVRPLLVVRSTKRAHTEPAVKPFSYKRIAVGCDLAAQSETTLACALRLASLFRATLQLVHAMETPLNEDQHHPMQGTYTQVQQALQERIHRRLAALVEPEALNGIELQTAVLQGIPGEELGSYAAKAHTNLLVIGVRRHGTLEKRVIGSTTEAVLRHAPCAVLVVPLLTNAGRDDG